MLEEEEVEEEEDQKMRASRDPETPLADSTLGRIICRQ
jgi:hypothetical protein